MSTERDTRFCSCGFVGLEKGLYSVQWYRLHRDHHLSVYPDVDEGTKQNLADAIAQAEEYEQRERERAHERRGETQE